MSLLRPLPALRPVPHGHETPRGVFSKSITAANPRFSSNFEVSRSLFITAKHAVLGPLPETEVETHQPIRDLNLVQIDALLERVPLEPVEVDDAFSLSPVLDRVLAVVSAWDPTFVEESSEDVAIVELKSRLFALIDVDDFLVRTIICRILLSFVTEHDSPLLVPVSQIFYKLSCDQANDMFFVEEGLVEVLIRLVRIGEPEARVFAAGAIKNIVPCREVQAQLLSGEFMELVKDVIGSNDFDTPLQLQIMGAVKTMCRSDEGRKVIAASGIVSRSIAESELFFESARILADLSDENVAGKGEMIAVLGRKDVSDEKVLRNCVRAIPALYVSDIEYGALLAKLLRSSHESDELVVLLNIAERVVEKVDVRRVFEQDGGIVRIVKSDGYDMVARLGAYNVLKKFVGEEFVQIIQEYAMFEGIAVA